MRPGAVTVRAVSFMKSGVARATAWLGVNRLVARDHGARRASNLRRHYRFGVNESATAARHRPTSRRDPRSVQFTIRFNETLPDCKPFKRTFQTKMADSDDGQGRLFVGVFS